MGVNDGADPPAPSTFSPTLVEVDIGGLVDFKTFVGQELDLNLRPTVPSINEDQLQGAAWAGHIPSETVFEARMRYYQAQQASLNNLAQYIAAAEVLIETIHQIVTMYSDRELTSTLDMNAVNAVFGQVRAELSADHETDRETRRVGGGNPR